MKITAKNLRYAAEAVLAYGLFFLFRLMPLDLASALGGWMGRTIGPRLAASRKARANLAAVLPDADHEKIVVRMWDNLGRVLAEYPHLEKIAATRVSVEGEEHLLRLRETGGPAVLVAGHLANWEIMGATALVRYGIDVTLTYRAMNNPLTEKLLYRARTLGGRIKASRKSREGAQQMLKTMRGGGVLGILIDQKNNEGLPVPFFGRTAMTSPAFVQFGRKFGCPVLPVRAERLEGARFRITACPPLTLSGSTEEAIGEAHALLEEWIRQDPGQWLWLHRRWPKRGGRGAEETIPAPAPG